MNKVGLRVLWYVALAVGALGLSGLPLHHSAGAFAEALAAYIPASVFWWCFGSLLVAQAVPSAISVRCKRAACVLGLAGGGIAAIVLILVDQSLTASFCFAIALCGAEGPGSADKTGSVTG